MTQYDKLKVAELKDLVKERGIASTGLKLKQHYIDALVVDDSAKENDAGELVEGKQEESQAEEQAEQQQEEDAPDEKGDDAGGAEEQQTEDVVVTDATQVDEPTTDESENANKRKRRSPTPPIREESVNKKLKVVDEKAEQEGELQVKLPEDAPAPVGEDEEPAQEKILPYATSDDVMQVDNAKELAADPAAVDDADAEQTQETSQTQQDDQISGEADPNAPAARHPTTRAIYIRELVRPVQPNNLRQHLIDLAQSTSSSSTPDVEKFHLDKLRTHAFALFDSISSASRVRSALHGKKWPDEPQRKELWVDFIPDDKVQEWTDVEADRADMTRWEVVYNSISGDTDGPVEATLQEAEAGGSGGARGSAPSGPPRPSVGEGMPNAPTGPRRDSRQDRPPPRHIEEEPRPAQSRGFDPLDQFFSSTEAKPKIYFKSVARELADRRLDEFEKETSRDWNDADADPSAYAEGELMRYTFEDGDRLVDGGPDFGLFGRRGRGGGFGGRGGRGRGGGDFYRGGRGGRRW